jgi:hypothetical protein
MVKRVLWVLLLVSAGCSGAIATEAPPPVVITATPIQIAIAQFPTSTPGGELPSTAFPTNTPESCTEKVDDQISYDVEADLDWADKVVEVEQTIYYKNGDDEPINKIVFHAEPNRVQGVLSLHGVLNENGTILPGAELTENRLTIPLPEPLRPGCVQVIQLAYRLQLPNIESPEYGRFGYLGYSNVQINLGQWLMTTAVYTGSGEWYIPQITNIGEQTIPEAATYKVTLSVDNPPPGLQIAAPGTRSRLADDQWQFELKDARDFALSLSDRFQVLNQAVEGTTIELYFIPDEDVRAPSMALQSTVRAFALFSQLFGPYPYERLVIVEGDFPDGMEFSGLAFVSEAWFRVWQGGDNDWLTIITVHEVAHQWWYLQVGNDQANVPYMDEALATYSELLYFESYLPQYVEWWWQFRINQYDSQRPVDSKVYNFNAVRPYINAVYLRGVKMMDDIRSALGDEAFFSWLQQYVDEQNGQIASPQDFWGTFSQEQYESLSGIRETYLQAPDVLLGQPAQELE